MFEPIPPSKLLKIYKGCSHCRLQKIKCNGQEPCARCKAFGLQCQYIVLPNQAAVKDSSSSASSTLASGAASKPRSTKKKSVSGSSISRKGAPPAIQLSAAASSKRRKETPSAELAAPSLPVPVHEDASDEPENPPPNVLLDAIVQAVDPGEYAYPHPRNKDEPCPGPETMRRLIFLYLQYLHPVHRVVNEDHPEFWNRLYHPMDSSTAVVVYAMCAAGALFTDHVPRSGHLDGLASNFYCRARAILDNFAPSAAFIQAYLILQSYLTATHQEDELHRALDQMLHAATEINLAETARQIAEQDKVSPADIALRNTWRGVVWAEILHHLHTRKGSLTIVPLKNLSGPVLETRPKDFPGSQLPNLDIFYYHLCTYFKILQSIAALKASVAPRDVHLVTALLDNITSWHASLPKNLRHASPPRPTSTAAASSSSSPSSSSSSGRNAQPTPHAAAMTLSFRLAHIFAINTLPSYLRYSPTGLGPRRESPLRILATSANGITATMEDVVKEPTLKHYCMFTAMRCLTEAASVQLSNAKEADPSISTPAKINVMKSLWCLRQANLSISPEVLAPLLDHFQPLHPGQSPKVSDGLSVPRSVIDKDATKETHSRTLNPGTEQQPASGSHQSLAFKTMRPPALVTESVVSDSSSTGGGQEQSPLSTPSMSPFQDADQRRGSFQYRPSMTPEANLAYPLSSPLHDGAASSLLALSLQSVNNSNNSNNNNKKNNNNTHSASIDGCSAAASRSQSLDPLAGWTSPTLKDGQATPTCAQGYEAGRPAGAAELPKQRHQPLPKELSPHVLAGPSADMPARETARPLTSVPNTSPLPSPDVQLYVRGTLGERSSVPPAPQHFEARTTSPTTVHSPSSGSHHQAQPATTAVVGRRRASVLSLLDRDRPGSSAHSQPQLCHQHPYSVSRRSSVSSTGAQSPGALSARKPLSLNLTLHMPPPSSTVVPEPAVFYSAPILGSDPRPRDGDLAIRPMSRPTMSISNPTTPSTATPVFSFRHETHPSSPLSAAAVSSSDRQFYFQPHHGSGPSANTAPVETTRLRETEPTLYHHHHHHHHQQHHRIATRRASEYTWPTSSSHAHAGAAAAMHHSTRPTSPGGNRGHHGGSTMSGITASLNHASGFTFAGWHPSEPAQAHRGGESQEAGPFGSSMFSYASPSKHADDHMQRRPSSSLSSTSTASLGVTSPSARQHSLQSQAYAPAGRPETMTATAANGPNSRHGMPYLEGIQEHHRSSQSTTATPSFSSSSAEDHASKQQAGDRPPAPPLPRHLYRFESRPCGDDYAQETSMPSSHSSRLYSGPAVTACARPTSPLAQQGGGGTMSLGQMAGRKRPSVSLYDPADYDSNGSSSGYASGNGRGGYNSSSGSSNSSGNSAYFGASASLYADAPLPAANADAASTGGSATTTTTYPTSSSAMSPMTLSKQHQNSGSIRP